MNWCNSLLWLDHMKIILYSCKKHRMLIPPAKFNRFHFFILRTYSCVIATVKKEEFISILPPPAHCLPAGLYTHPQYMLRVRNRRNRNFFNTCKKPNWLLVSIDWFMMSTSYILVPSLMGASGYIFKVLLYTVGCPNMFKLVN